MKISFGEVALPKSGAVVVGVLEGIQLQMRRHGLVGGTP